VSGPLTELKSQETPEIGQEGDLSTNVLVIDLLDCLPDPVFILDENRKIVLANDKLNNLLRNPRRNLTGLAVGEALGCVFATRETCGTLQTASCRLCGGALAIRRCQTSGTTEIRDCQINSRDGDGRSITLDLRVWAKPLEVEGATYTLISLRDITQDRRRKILERIFFHDLLNIAGGLQEVLKFWSVGAGQDSASMSRLAQEMASQLMEEIIVQRDLAHAEQGELKVDVRDLNADVLLEQIKLLCAQYPGAQGKTIQVSPITDSPRIRSDGILLMRVLGNLIKNALEASGEGQTVTLTFQNRGEPTFLVHNETGMSNEVKKQIFRRSFSTKSPRGRGIGTYSIKLLTERYLGGKVSFTSSEEGGTTFQIQLPGSPSP